MRRVRLGVVASHFIQYQVPIWRELAQRDDLDVRVHYLSDSGHASYLDQDFGCQVAWDRDLASGYDWELLAGNGSGASRRFGHRASMDSVSKLVAGDFDVWLRSDYGTIGGMIFFYRALGARRPVIYRGDTNLEVQRRDHLVKRMALHPLFKRLFWGAYVGELAREYMLAMGMDEARLFASPHSVDTQFWTESALSQRGLKRELKQRLGLPVESTVVLFCGKLAPVKRPLDFVQALSLVRPGHSFSALIVGSGDLEREVARGLNTLGIPHNVAGFVNQRSLPEYYGASDILCLPSTTESWGLVVNEAMHFGVIPVVSDRVGCRVDLVEGIGEVHPVGAPAQLAESLVVAARNLEERRALIPSRIAQYTTSRSAEGIAAAAKAATSRR